MNPSVHVALLRGINVGGRNLLPMPRLRSLCLDLGWTDVRTYIQSGNVVFRADRTRGELEVEIEEAIERRFGIEIDVLVRTADEWRTYLAANPFPEASREQPNLVMMALSRSPPPDGAAETLLARAVGGERIEQGGGVLWLHYPNGAGRSKVSPGLLDRVVGSPVTTRNWRTVLKLAELTGETP